MAGMVKDAGDDPDVTHGAIDLRYCSYRRAWRRCDLSCRRRRRHSDTRRTADPAGRARDQSRAAPHDPRQYRRGRRRGGRAADAEVEISIPGGETLAAKTLNGRLGIVGGLSILGTTGIVVPYSCSAWIHSIHSGIDVARAAGLTHIAGATGASSEAGVQKLYGLPEIALIDMGDFVGGMLKYLRRHPVARVTIAGGVAKMTKLAQGLTDLHSKRGEVALAELANFAAAVGGDAHLCQRIVGANTAAEAFTLAQDAGIPLGDAVALAAQHTAEDVIAGRDIAVEVVLFDREQNLVGRAPFKN